MEVLTVKNLCKRFNTFSLDNISFSIPPGTIMGLIGANGAGKTTIIKLIMQLLTQDSGDITVFGQDTRSDFKRIKQKIGFVYDGPFFYENLTIKAMTRIMAPFYPDWQWDTYHSYREQFKLDENKKIAELSKGMKTKYALLTALSHRAEFIIMDEPASGLDPIFRREFLDIIYDAISDEKCSILFSTHITTDLERIADYVTFIQNGNLVFSKTKEAVFSEYRLVKGGLEVLNGSLEKNFIGIKKTPFGFEALSNRLQELPENCLIEKPTLDDIMVYYEKSERSK